MKHKTRINYSKLKMPVEDILMLLAESIPHRLRWNVNTAILNSIGDNLQNNIKQHILLLIKKELRK